ncbi:uncharacterized protein LOC116298800 [Actinia tenebrosa]|uniref:Uncharacterized protein LOC116298800 n=1 Tax=Actinia tenebrosa TaxID=6105 RepID=A0A6P8I3S3_ACTTE|nr:uncharacterized protein LOC116298800 [Actinia tenebrosa]
MPCSQTRELQSKVKCEKDEVVLAKAETLGQEGNPSKHNNVKTSNNDEPLEEQRKKRDHELKENKPLHTEEDKNVYNTVVQRRNSDGKIENIPNYVDKDVNNLNDDVVRQKPNGLDEKTLTRIDQNNTNDSDKKILFILVESEITQVGNNNHMMIEDERKNSEESSSDLHMSCIVKKHRGRGRKVNRRPRSRSNSSTMNKVYIAEAVLKNIPPASPSDSYIQLCRISDEVMLQLQVVRDNGKWELFDDIVVTLSRKYQSKEAEIVILLEKSMAACYQSRLEESTEMILKAIDMAKETENSSVLTGRGFHYLSGVYRRQNLMGKANDCVIKSEQNFHNKHLTLDSTFLAYERASVLMDFISKCPNPPASMINDAKAGLIKCIDGCTALEEDTECLRYVKKHHFAFIKRAMLLLDCRTASGRKRTVSQESIKEAEKSLKTLRTRYWDGIAQGEKVQYFLGLADLYFRLEDFPKAEETANEVLSMAKTFGFNTEIKPAQDRLEEIARKQQVKKEPCCYGNSGYTYTSSDISEGQNGDVSSSESDFMETPSYY